MPENAEVKQAGGGESATRRGGRKTEGNAGGRKGENSG